MTAVALLGTGIMGSGMARHLGKAGLSLRVWNRSREKAEPLSDVATVTDTAAEAVDGADGGTDPAVMKAIRSVPTQAADRGHEKSDVSAIYHGFR